MPAIKQIVELHLPCSLENYASVRFRVDEPSGKTTYFDSVHDALKVANSRPGCRAFIETMLEIKEK